MLFHSIISNSSNHKPCLLLWLSFIAHEKEIQNCGFRFGSPIVWKSCVYTYTPWQWPRPGYAFQNLKEFVLENLQ